MSNLKIFTEEGQSNLTTPIGRATIIETPRKVFHYKSMQSLPNNYKSSRKSNKKMNTIIEQESPICEIPPIKTYDKRISFCDCVNNSIKNNYNKAITSIPLKRLNTNCSNAPQNISLTTSNRMVSNNEISFKERRLIRQSTIKTKMNLNKVSDFHDTYNQTTQFKSFQSGFMATESHDGYQSSIPPIQTNIELFSEPNTESEISTSQVNKRNQNRKELLKLIKTNPYKSLKKNIYYTFRKNQITFAKYSISKPVMNGMKTKEGALYKINKSSTLYIQNKSNRKNLILRLLERRNEMTSEFKNVIFWKGIQWLWNIYFVQIEKLLLSFQNYKWFLEKDKMINFKKVEEFLILIQLKKSREFCEALFLIFDQNNYKHINLKFVLTVLIATNKIIYKDQMKDTFEVWESGKSGKIQLSEIIEIIKDLFSKKQDFKKLLEIVKNKYQISDCDNVVIDKKELFELFLKDNKIAYFFRKNKVNLEEIDQDFKEEILNLYNINMRNSKMSLETHDAQKFCENDINKYEQVLSAVLNHDNAKVKQRMMRINNGDGDMSDE